MLAANSHGDDGALGDDGSMTTTDSLVDIVAGLRCTFDSGVTRPLRWRREALLSLRRLYEDHTDAMATALMADLGGGKPRLCGELFGVPNINMALDNLEFWAADRPAKHEWALGWSFVRPEPKGVVLIIGAWNFPIKQLVEPLIAALAAGNVALLKPSEHAPAIAALLALLLPKYLPPSVARVVQGGVAETTALLAQPFDHIFYTGSAAVGRYYRPPSALIGLNQPVPLARSRLCPSLHQPTWPFRFLLFS